MKRILFFLATLFFMSCTLPAQELYLNTFGKKSGRPIIYLHGGPGGSCLDFELSTAQKLADQGFFVILYDRRGEGRSVDDSARYDFQQTLADISALYEKYDLATAALVGHSFGGIVAVKYAERYPEKVSHLVLVGAPVALQQSFKTILRTTKAIALEKKDTAAISLIKKVENYDTASIYYSSGCFMLAMQNGVYNTKTPSKKAKELYKELMESKDLKNYTSCIEKTGYKTVMQPVMGFLKNESYTSIHLVESLKEIKAHNVPVFGMYGKEDGLFDASQIALIRKIAGDNDRFLYLDHCSHGVFMDQQKLFIRSLDKWLK